MAKKRIFKKLRNHLTSTELDEKAAMLENITRMPTNNTAFVFQGDPSNPQGNSFETITDGETDETDYNIGENPTSSTEARDTTGLFNSGGDHSKGEFVKTVEPPGDTSYVLGPMAAMYYTWSYPWTMVGYIRESDRKMVNLGRIDGKLSDWDGSSGNGSSGSGTFYSYGQLTTEQALWFRDIKKAFGNTNDPTTYSYRAFYPGPPSATPDAYGRYPCILTGISKVKPNTHPDSTPLDKQAGDNFSAMDALMRQFKKDGTLQSIYKGGKLVFDKAKQIFGDKKARANANISVEDEKFLRNQQTLINLTKGLGAIGLPNDFAQWTINYAKGDMTPITKFSPGMERQVRDLVLDKFKKNPNSTTVDIQYGDYGYGFKALPTRLGLGRFTATKLPNGKIKIQDTFNVDKDFTTVGAADIVPGLQKTADRLVDISYKTRNIEGRTDEAGITIDVDIRGEDVIPQYQQNRNKLNNQRQQQSSSDPFANEVKPKLGVKDGDKLAGTFDLMKSGQVPFMTKDQVDKILVDPKYQKLLQDDPDLLPILRRMRVKNDKKKPTTMVAHYHDKRKSLIEIRKPTILPETKQKSYKVSPGQRYKDKNKKPETNFQDMDKLFNKNIGGPQPFKPQERTSWTKDFIAQNVMKSQEKMNGVLEMIGDGKHAFDHATNDYKKMGVKELEQYWGKNPNMYSFMFNGKKYNVTRKEHIENDSIVFMEDQKGVKSNMLQSELNLKLQEQNEKWIEEAYFKSHPVIPEKKESTYELIKRRFLENKKIAPEFPAEPPPKMVNGYHPKFGKHAARYKKLDPASANAMPETGDPETDELVRKQKTINKIKKMTKNK